MKGMTFRAFYFTTASGNAYPGLLKKAQQILGFETRFQREWRESANFAKIINIRAIRLIRGICVQGFLVFEQAMQCFSAPVAF